MSLTGLTVLLVTMGILVVAALVGLVMVFVLDRDDEPPLPERKSPTAGGAVTRSTGSPSAAVRKKPAATPAGSKHISPATSAGASVVKTSATSSAAKAASPATPKKVGAQNKVVAVKASKQVGKKASPMASMPVASPSAEAKAKVAHAPRPPLIGTEGSSDVSSAAPKAGWYPDPGGDGQRYWNGEAWAYHRSATPSPPRRRWWHDRTKLVAAVVVASLAIAAATIGLVIYNSDESRFNRCVSNAMRQYPDAPLGVAYIYCDQFFPDRGTH
mgnify:CR=1 FL=1